MLKVHRWFILVGIVFIVFIALSVDFRTRKMENDLTAWLKEFNEKAYNAGVGEQTLEEFKQKVKVSKAVLEDKKTASLGTQISSLIDDELIFQSQIFFKDNIDSLHKREVEYLISPEVVVATAGIGSRFGSVLGNETLVDVLATLATKAEDKTFYEGEIISLLKLIDRGYVSMSVKGRVDGTFTYLGINPSVYLFYGIDANENGRIDLFSDKDDILETTFYVLNQQGWSYLNSWGVKVKIPSDLEVSSLEGLSNAKVVAIWKSLGFKAHNGENIAEADTTKAVFIKLSNTTGVLLYPNFDAIFKINNSLVKSVAIALLSEELVNYTTLMDYKNKKVTKDSSMTERKIIEAKEKVQKRKERESMKKDDLPPPKGYEELDFAK